VRGQAEAWFVRPRANTVRIDPATGEVLSVQKATEISAYHRWSDMADPLHFGTFGGWWSQAAWFAFGLLLSSLMLSGGWLWHLRAEKKAIAAGADRHPRWGYAAAALPVLTIVASGVFGFQEVEQHYMMREAPRQIATQTHAIGPWQAQLLQMRPPTGEAPSYRVGFAGPEGAAANLKEAALGWTGTADSTAATLHPQVPVTRTLTGAPPAHSDATLTLTATAWDGATHTATLPVPHANGADVRTAELSIPPVPAAVWWVVGLFSVGTMALVGAWLYFAQQTARRRTRTESGGGDAAPSAEARPVAVSADLPSPG
jgi:hypothetical protein